ncbi:MAG: hypothetical protein JWN33_264 [Candidatus Saccharibacteria bacterium]|nr:hypothetical protein [Candidatus Saccharibacteria bacterium]
MSEITVDTEKLTYGLELGIGNTRTIFASLPPEERLRLTACGLVSAAIHAYAIREGIPSRLMLSTPQFSFIDDIQHVFPLIGAGDDPTVIDASASQFLGYAGISVEYQDITGQSIFPPEKVLSFALSERHLVVNWLAKAVLNFRAVNQRPVGKFGRQLGEGPLANASTTQLKEEYGSIWNPENTRRWDAPEHVQRDGEVVSRYISPGAIVV